MESTKCEQDDQTVPHVTNSYSISCEITCYECDLCTKLFLSEPKLREHRDLFHTTLVDLKCTICPKKFQKSVDLEKHKTSHEKVPGRSVSKKFQCDECADTFDMHAQLTDHVRTYHTQRLYVECDKCEIICFNEDILAKHRKVCGRKPRNKNKRVMFTCGHCRRRFGTEKNLKQHAAFCRNKAGDHQTCDTCGLSFAKRYIKTHVTVCAQKNRMYKCNVCEKGFKEKEDLFQHFFDHKFLQGYDLLL